MEHLIPEIDKKIEIVLKKLKLKPSVPPKKFIRKTKSRKHRYFSLCTDAQGTKLIFYARLHKNPDAKQKMVREISFFRKTKGRHLKISKFFPKICQSKIEKDFEWFVRQYLPHSPMGTNEQLKGRIKKSDVVLLAKAIYLIKNTSLSLLRSIPLKKFPVKDYLGSKNLVPYLLEKKIINKKEAGGIIKFFEENTDLLKKENKCFSHGDFNLGNLIISNKTLKIIDWESIQINNLASDIAYLFTHLWQAKKSIRKELIKVYFNLLSKKEKSVFKKLFPIVVSDLAADGFEARPREIKAPLLKKRKEFFKKLLKGPFLGFEKLISI